MADAARSHDALAAHAAALMEAVALVADTTRALLAAAARGQVDRYLANAAHYLDLVGHVTVAALWLDQARAALRLQAAGGDAEFCAGKLAACRYFFGYELPRVRRDVAILQALDDTTLTAPEGGF